MAQTILITGANRGVGREMARLAAARGDTVLGTARDAAGLAEIDALAAEGAVTSFGLDVTDPERASDLGAMLSDRAIDLVVCNAGALIGRGGLDDALYADLASWRLVLETNVAGPFFTARAFLPSLLKSEAGKIAVISSRMGATSLAAGSAYIYRASKAAATNLAMNLAAELKPQGVAVGAYHPGWVRTDMGGEAADLRAEESAAGLLERFDALSIETTGVIEDYTGDAIPL